MELNNKFKYKLGDKVRSLAGAEYQIIDATPNIHLHGPEHVVSYRLKSLVSGCLDKPFWVNIKNIYKYYEPCSNAAKVLYGNAPRPSEGRNPSNIASSPSIAQGGVDGD